MGPMSTILDVAKIAGVSTATVSRVINSPDQVKEETREKVYRAMKTCRYQYNALARGFVTKRSNTIGLIIPTISNPVFAESTRGVQDVAGTGDFHVILGNSYYDGDKEAKLIEVLRERQVEGLIITTTNMQGEILKRLQDDGFPFVLLYSTVRKGPMSAVGVDNYLGGYRATEHLIKLGHTRIAMLAGNFSISDRSFHRWHGYKKCLKDHDIPYDAKMLRQTGFGLGNVKECVQELLSSDSPPTAVFCSNDLVALSAMEGAREMGLDVPGNLSVVGFDDMPLSSYVYPRLTTIYQPAYDMGRRATEILMSQTREEKGKPVQEMMGVRLVVRDSTAPPRG
ncbi:MAG: LacI family transcriptional regulator [Desulfobacterales bacterium]|nr:LacI family transcriptional regulator [Desulfobacterales bacterium]